MPLRRQKHEHANLPQAGFASELDDRELLLRVIRKHIVFLDQRSALEYVERELNRGKVLVPPGTKYKSAR
jgi:hypothetical protein